MGLDTLAIRERDDYHCQNLHSKSPGKMAQVLPQQFACEGSELSAQATHAMARDATFSYKSMTQVFHQKLSHARLTGCFVKKG
jgi:hypothetical protein